MIHEDVHHPVDPVLMLFKSEEHISSSWCTYVRDRQCFVWIMTIEWSRSSHYFEQCCAQCQGHQAKLILIAITIDDIKLGLYNLKTMLNSASSNSYHWNIFYFKQTNQHYTWISSIYNLAPIRKQGMTIVFTHLNYCWTLILCLSVPSFTTYPMTLINSCLGNGNQYSSLVYWLTNISQCVITFVMICSDIN